MWCGVMWCGVVRFSEMWFSEMWCGVVWCGVVWCGVVWCGVVWCGVVWCGVVWCGVVWCGVVWCGVVWCGVVDGRVWLCYVRWLTVKMAIFPYNSFCYYNNNIDQSLFNHSLLLLVSFHFQEALRPSRSAHEHRD